MSQFIVLGTNDINYNISDLQINNVTNNSLLFSKNGYIAGIQAPSTSNNFLQYDPNTQTYIWNELTFSTITGNNETTQGILWNDSNDYLRMMSGVNGVYNIEIKNDTYTLIPAVQGNVSLLGQPKQNDLIVAGANKNTLRGISPSNGYLYYNSNGGWQFHNPIQIINTSGLIFYDNVASTYKGVTGTTDGLYAVSKTGSSIVNITQKDGFLIASNKNITSLGYPTESGEYSLLVDQNNSMSWKKKEILANKVQDIVINSPIVNGGALTTITVAGDYIITFDFVTQVNILQLPPANSNFDTFLETCPKLEIIDSVTGIILLTKIFTGPLSYDYFSFTVLEYLMEGAKLLVKFTNNGTDANPIVKITSCNMTLTYVENAEDNYDNESGPMPSNGIIYASNYTGRVMINLDINFIVDLINTPKTSQIIVSVGANKIYLSAIPPVADQYYNINRVYNIFEGDTISVVTNESNYVKIKNYNLIVNRLS